MKRILIIDDDDVMREAATASLSTVGGYEVLSAAGAEEGIRVAQEKTPDGVLLDVGMPGMEGPDVLEALRRDPATRDIPVVFFTGDTTSKAAASWQELGASGFIAKPFDFPALPVEFSRLVGWADTTTDEPAAQDGIQGIWERRREEVEGRVRTIEEVALALMEDRLTSGLLEEGTRAAHKLAGTLGSFGFVGGSALASEAESLLRAGAPTPAKAAAVRLSELVVGLDDALDQGLPLIADSGPEDTADSPEGPESPAEAARQRRVGVDARTPAPIRAALASGGVDVVEVDTHDAATDPSDGVAVLVLHVGDNADADADGYDRCRTLRERCADPAFPIILSIPGHDAESIRRAFSAGADDIVVRPVVGPELLARVDGQLDRARLRATLPFTSVTGHGADGCGDRNVDVVIVDDDAALSDLLDHALRLRGYSVERFSDGADAAAALVGDPAAVSSRVILLDVGLPGLDGIALLRRLRREGVLQRTHVVMLTSHSMESEVLKALELGAFDHVAKPFSMPILMHRLQRALMC